MEQPSFSGDDDVLVEAVTVRRGTSAVGRREAKLLRTRINKRRERVLRARDVAMASLTIPTHRRQSRCVNVGTVASPAVRPDLWELHVRYARSRDDHDRSQLIAEYEGHARSVAKRFYRHREPLEDLTQVALEGLLVSLERFDPGRRRPFLAFASPTIMGLLKHHYRDSGWAVRVPRRVHEMARPVREAAELLAQDLGRPGTTYEIADLLGVEEWRVREASVAETARATASLDAAVAEGGESLGSAIGGLDPRFAQVDNRQTLLETLRMLPEQDRQLLRMYFDEELTQSQIARRMGVSQMHISRSISSAVRRLRSRIPTD